ncbi:16640_t:CDS:2 [Funneliformis geosporum]|nr:16640_t:CDS:2 [Funneliformis geosporum]
MDYLFNLVFGRNIIEKKPRNPAKPAKPTPPFVPFSSKKSDYLYSNSNSKQNRKSHSNAYYDNHKFHKGSFNKTRYSSTKSHHQNHHKMPPAAFSTFHPHTSAFAAATMNSPSNINSPNKTPQNRRVIDSEQRYRVVDDICGESNLYKILGVEQTCSSEELRRAYISVSNFQTIGVFYGKRSRICHPDKFPEYPKATEAFQKLAYAYETLNKPSSRRAYDISGTSDLGSVSGMGDETLHGVLYQLFLEFMDGDFEMIRALVSEYMKTNSIFTTETTGMDMTPINNESFLISRAQIIAFIDALNEGNPGLNLGDDAIETLETAFRRMRELLLAGKKYVKVVQFELIRLYELQQLLRSLSYFDVFGRLRVTMQLARSTLTIPILVDNAMKEEFDTLGNKGINKGLLGDGMAKVITSLVAVLERGEQYF